jgi:hypothetical protein
LLTRRRVAGIPPAPLHGVDFKILGGTSDAEIFVEVCVASNRGPIYRLITLMIPIHEIDNQGGGTGWCCYKFLGFEFGRHEWTREKHSSAPMMRLRLKLSAEAAADEHRDLS